VGYQLIKYPAVRQIKSGAEGFKIQKGGRFIGHLHVRRNLLRLSVKIQKAARPFCLKTAYKKAPPL
jgi:hypothetical protein